MNQWTSIVVLSALLEMLCLAYGVCASAPGGTPWKERIGTIANVRSLPDGTHVYLDAEEIAKIETKQDPAYFVIIEPFSYEDRLVVLTTPSPDLRPRQNVDVEGIITTMSNGTRALVDVTVWGYADGDGELLYHAPLIKGFLERTPWNHMIDLTVRAQQTASRNAGTNTTSDVPNTDMPPGAKLYTNIADITSTTAFTVLNARVQDYTIGPPSIYSPLPGSLVGFQCKRITAVGSETIDGVTYSYMDVSDDPPETGTIRAYYTGAASTTDRVNKISGQLCYVGSTAVLCVDSGPGYNPQMLSGTCQLFAQGTIAWAKTFQDGTQLPAALPQKIVSADFTTGLGYYYVQEQNRTSGIQLDSGNNTGYSPGSKISISAAQVATVGNERVLIVSPNNVNLIGSGFSIFPFGMPNKAVVGGPLNVLTPGATNGNGLNNVGLLVRTWGTTSNVQPAHFYINDGSDNTGIMVDLNIGGASNISTSIQAGDYATVTGIVKLATVNGYNMRVVKPRNADDIHLVQAAPHFTNIIASPQQVVVADVVTITFDATKVLPINPTVTVNGHAASYLNSNVSGSYTYQYTVLSTDQPGWAIIKVTGSKDGLTGSANANNILFIGTYSFDNVGNRVSMVDSRGVTYYDYDVLGRLVHVTEPDGKWIAYQYDLNNNRTCMTIHLSDNPLVQHTTQYAYNSRNLLWHVTDQLGGVTTYTYKPNGLVDTITYPNGTKAIHTYNNRNWLVQISNQKSDETIIAQFDYSYNATYSGRNGNPTSVIENILKPDGTRINAKVDYEYDNLYRLTREHRSAHGGGDPGVSYDYYYAYDAAGNRTSWQVIGGTTMSYGYDSANKMTSPGAFTYDDAGNLLSWVFNDVTTSYVWDYRNLLTKWSQTNQTTKNYIYDGNGIRVAATPSGGNQTNYLLDGSKIVEQLTGSSSISYANPDLISRISNSVRNVYHADGFGSTRAMTDSSTPTPNVTVATIYDAYGNVVAVYGGSPTFGYMGRYHCYTDDTGLDYFKTRYYWPNIARFISRDTIGYRDGLNPYMSNSLGNRVDR